MPMMARVREKMGLELKVTLEVMNLRIGNVAGRGSDIDLRVTWVAPSHNEPSPLTASVFRDDPPIVNRGVQEQQSLPPLLIDPMVAVSGHGMQLAYADLIQINVRGSLPIVPPKNKQKLKG